MEKLNKEIARALDEQSGWAAELRRHFHAWPEVSAEEEKTALKIEEVLDGLKIPHARYAKTGVVGTIEGNNPESAVIALRADIDALPLQEQSECSYASKNKGKMHACGHDAHTASLLAAARVLAEARDRFDGSVRLVFQPGEEIGYGARAMIEQGVLEGVDRVFGLHVASDLEAGKVLIMAGVNNASVDQFKITVHGQPAHISQPEKGANAACAISQIVLSAQSLVTCRTSPLEPVLLGIGRIEAGTAYNIGAGQGVIEGTLRTFNPEVRKKILRELEQLAVNSAGIYGASVQFENRDNTSVLVNDPLASAQAAQSAGRFLGREHVLTKRTPILGGDDFAEFLQKVPGVYAYVGSSNPSLPQTCLPLHDSSFDIDEKALTVAAKLYALYALDFLSGRFEEENPEETLRKTSA